MSKTLRCAVFASLVALPTTALADMSEIVDVVASKPDMGWRFDVTIKHPDTGWDHYADGWEILDENGKRLGYRELHHPHVNEQPFTRSLRGVMIPDGVRTIYVRARCSTDGWASEKVAVELMVTGQSKY